MRRGIKFVSVLVMVLLLVGCASLSEKWSTLTPDQQARIVISGMQDQLGILFTNGKMYVGSNPQYASVWKTQIIPAFDTANKSLATYTVYAMQGKTTPSEVYNNVQPLIDSVMKLLISIGAVKGGA